MVERNTGGHAFPTKVNSAIDDVPGMSLRDYFAAKAMAAIIVGNDADVSVISLGAARDAYAVADHMLKARSE